MGVSASFPVLSLPRNRIVVVTGGNNGIGYETAKQIAMMGATVIIACRSEEKAQNAIKRMNEEYAALKTSEQLQKEHIKEERLPVEFMKLDLSSLKSTMQFIEAFKSSGRKLHTLLCNAGVRLVNREITEDGYETHFQVNYLGHFLIIAHLLPIMKASGEDCRIVFTSSHSHKYAHFDLAKAQCENPADFGKFLYYRNSKLYQVQHMFALSRRLVGSNITVMSHHPGGVSTGLFQNYEETYPITTRIIKKFTRTPLQGATTLIDAAVNLDKKGMNDSYLVDCSPASVTSTARNKEYQEQLWRYSKDCLKEYLPDDLCQEIEGKIKE